MIVHVNVLELITPGSFTLVTCNCTLRYKQKTDIKPKLLTVLNIRDSKKALGPFIREEIRRVLCKTRLT